MKLKNKAFLEGVVRSIDLFGLFLEPERTETSMQLTRKNFRVVANRIRQAHAHQLSLLLGSKGLSLTTGDRAKVKQPARSRPLEALGKAAKRATLSISPTPTTVVMRDPKRAAGPARSDVRHSKEMSAGVEVGELVRWTTKRGRLPKKARHV